MWLPGRWPGAQGSSFHLHKWVAPGPSLLRIWDSTPLNSPLSHSTHTASGHDFSRALTRCIILQKVFPQSVKSLNAFAFS